jgi:hypothetical protein
MNKQGEGLIRVGIAPVAGAIIYGLTPPVTSKNPPTGLSTFFTTSAALLGTFLIALAVLALISPLASLRIRRIVGQVTFVYLALGIIAAVAGTAIDWPNPLYDYFFATTAGTGIAAVVAVTRVGIENMRIQRDETHSVLAHTLGATRGTGNGGN